MLAAQSSIPRREIFTARNWRGWSPNSQRTGISRGNRVWRPGHPRRARHRWLLPEDESKADLSGPYRIHPRGLWRRYVFRNAAPRPSTVVTVCTNTASERHFCSGLRGEIYLPATYPRPPETSLWLRIALPLGPTQCLRRARSGSGHCQRYCRQSFPPRPGDANEPPKSLKWCACVHTKNRGTGGKLTPDPAVAEGADRRAGRVKRTGGRGHPTGTPQGGVLSPLLAKIYMNRFLRAWRKRGMDRRLKAKVVNYADDFVILCRGTAAKALAVTQRWMGSPKPKLNEKKTGLQDARRESFDFLGYTFGPAVHRPTGRAYLAAQPSRKAVARLRDRVVWGWSWEWVAQKGPLAASLRAAPSAVPAAADLPGDFRTS